MRQRSGILASILVAFAIILSGTAYAQLGSLLNNNKEGGGAGLLGGMLNNKGSGGNNPLSGMLGGSDGNNPLSGMLGGSGNGNSELGSDGDSSSQGLFSVMQDVLDSAKNTNLGPMGRYVLGRNLSARIIGGSAVIEASDPRVAYVRNVAITIMQSSRYGANYVDPVVILLDDDKLINAFAAPGGFVFITTAMLDFLKNEDELAFVLAHEIAHIELDHGLSAIKQNEGAKLFSKGTQAMGVDEGGNMFGGFLDFAENGYSKDLEAEADMRGAKLASALGYDYQAGIAVIKRLEKITGRAHGTGYPEDRARLLESGSGGNVVAAEAVQIRTQRYQQSTAK